MVRQLALPETRCRLVDLLGRDLAFHNGVKGSSIHALHAFAARFPPPLPRHFIVGLTEPGDVVLDPMAGSGATLVEGWLHSRNVIGTDLDPLALLQCKAKTSGLEPGALERAGGRALDSAWLSSRTGQPMATFCQGIEPTTREFIDNWFKPETQQELAALVAAIDEEPDGRYRGFLRVLLSSVIVTKSGGVSLARDLAHTRPHKVENKTPRSALVAFSGQLSRAVKALQELTDTRKGLASVLAADCRYLPLSAGSVDLIVTSPPYANALDYVRAHKFSLAWLGHSIRNLARLRGYYIGAERLDRRKSERRLPSSVSLCVTDLDRKDPQKARVLAKYFRDMALSLGEMHRVLRRGRAAIIVIGPSTMREQPIETHEHLASIAGEVGFDVVGIARRLLDRDRRMMPVTALRQAQDTTNNAGQSLIEQRIHEEYVLGLVKP